jgi:hypothetical protein
MALLVDVAREAQVGSQCRDADVLAGPDGPLGQAAGQRVNDAAQRMQLVGVDAAGSMLFVKDDGGCNTAQVADEAEVEAEDTDADAETAKLLCREAEPLSYTRHVKASTGITTGKVRGASAPPTPLATCHSPDRHPPLPSPCF